MASALEHLMELLSSLAGHFAAKLAQVLAILRKNQASAGVAAIAALAISIFFAWRLARLHPGSSHRRRKQDDPRRTPGQGPTAPPSSSSSSSPSSSLGSGAHDPSSSASQAGAAGMAPGSAAQPVLSPLVSAVRKQLGGAQRVSCHILGVLLRQGTPAELGEGATVIPSAAEVILEVARQADLYLVAQVEDDAGEVAILSALESRGILGPGSPFNSSKLLFCSTETGIMSFVRQLESDLHIESSFHVVDQLKRFVKKEVYIARGKQHDPVVAANVVTAASLEDFMGASPSLH